MIATDSIVRPADVTAYTAGDVVSTLAGKNLLFGNIATQGGSILRAVTLIDDANVAPKPDLELWLFDSAPVAVADNAAFAPSDAEMKRLIGVVVLATANFKIANAGAAAAGNSAIYVTGLDMPIRSANGTLYGQLVVRNAYVPVSGEEFTIRLQAEQ